MLSYFNRLKSKKGFTLIELIVVIAIMGVLLAMILPAMTGSNKDEIGKGLAKDFFYRAQDIMCDAKMTSSDAFSGFAADDTVFYAEIDEGGSVIEVGFLSSLTRVSAAKVDPSTETLEMLSAFTGSSSFSDSFKKVMTKFVQNVDNYATSQDEMAGTLYAVVSAKDRVLPVTNKSVTVFSVQAAYWSDMPAAEMSTAGTIDITLEDDNVLHSGYYCCAYPTKLSTGGKQMYNYDYAT